MSEKSIDEAVNYLYKHGQKYAEAKAHRLYMDEYRKTLKSMIMKKAMEEGARSVAAAEIEAYCDPEYVKHLQGHNTPQFLAERPG